MNKDLLLQLLAQDDLEQALSALLADADQSGQPTLRTALVHLSGQLEDWKKARLRNDLPDTRMTEMRNGIRGSLLELVESLPEETAPSKAPARPKGMLESRFKNIVFWAMLAGNAAAFLVLFVLGEGSGTFTPSETMTTCSLLLSPLAAYFSVMFSEVVAQRSGEVLSEAEKNRRIGSRFQRVSLVVLAAYFFLVCYLMLYRSQISFSEFTGWLAALEGGLGVFVAQVVHALFRKEG
jgi:Effector-associated domain 11